MWMRKHSSAYCYKMQTHRAHSKKYFLVLGILLSNICNFRGQYQTIFNIRMTNKSLLIEYIKIATYNRTDKEHSLWTMRNSLFITLNDEWS